MSPRHNLASARPLKARVIAGRAIGVRRRREREAAAHGARADPERGRKLDQGCIDGAGRGQIRTPAAIGVEIEHAAGWPGTAALRAGSVARAAAGQARR